jgi:hypothetical protein
MIQDRAVLNVVKRDGDWVVELDGLVFEQSPDREVAKASANKRARELQDGGRACQVCISGELGF